MLCFFFICLPLRLLQDRQPGSESPWNDPRAVRVNTQWVQAFLRLVQLFTFSLFALFFVCFWINTRDNSRNMRKRHGKTSGTRGRQVPRWPASRVCAPREHLHSDSLDSIQRHLSPLQERIRVSSWLRSWETLGPTDISRAEGGGVGKRVVGRGGGRVGGDTKISGKNSPQFLLD